MHRKTIMPRYQICLKLWYPILGAALLALPAQAVAKENQKNSAASKAEVSRSADNPWTQGISKENRDLATALYKEGTGYLNDGAYVLAAEKLRESASLWDHPMTHYNLVLALNNLDQPIESYQHLTAALKYGKAMFDNEQYEYALKRKAELENEVGLVTVNCSIEGAKVTMDGVDLLTGPNAVSSKWVRAGNHIFIASKEGYVTREWTVNLKGVQLVALDLSINSVESMTDFRRKWTPKTPWLWVGGGAALAVVGGVFHIIGASKTKSFNSDIEKRCSDNSCVPGEPSDISSKGRTGKTLQGLGVGMYVVGGAAMATGAVLAYMNRLQPYLRPYPESDFGITPLPSQDTNNSSGKNGSDKSTSKQGNVSTFEIYPIIDGSTAGLVTSFWF